MRTHARLLLISAAILALGIGFLDGTSGNTGSDQNHPPVVPPAMANQIIQESVKNLQQGLKKPKAKASAAQLRSNAFLIALAAQNNMGQAGADLKQLATLRDAALNVAKAAEGTTIKLDEAQKAAQVLALFPKVQTDPAAKTDPVDLKDVFELDDVMTMFKKANKGGQGIEVELITMGSRKRPFKPVQMAKFELNAYKIALIGELVGRHDDSAKGNKKEWRSLSEAMQQAALELIAVGKAKNGKEFKKVVAKLNHACDTCHEKFR